MCAKSKNFTYFVIRVPNKFKFPRNFMTNCTKNANFHQEKWLDCFFDHDLGLVFEFVLIYGYKTHLTKVILPQYMLIWSIHPCFCGKIFTRVNIYHALINMNPGTFRWGYILLIVEYFSHLGCKCKALGYTITVPKLNF